jgi:mannobiose 2-epimerase
MRLSEKDQNEKKSMNNHLHVLEAYANLLQVWPDEREGKASYRKGEAPGTAKTILAERLRELIELFCNRILDESQTHFRHFFDERWNVKSDSYTFGHDIEGSWLLCEAAEVLQDDSLAAEVRTLAVKIAKAVLLEGLDADGGLCYEARRGAIIDRSKEWWPQAEAVVGFWNAWQISGDAALRNAALQVWHFIQEKIVDRKNGEWFWRIDEQGVPDDTRPKISAWKCPYHNGRCCLEILRRLGENA